MIHTFNTGKVAAHPCSLTSYRPTYAEIEREQMLFQADYDFAYKNGGHLTRLLLDDLAPIWADQDQEGFVRVDTRFHMLMPGWYPCIPGWHCDFMQSAGALQLPNPERDARVKHYQYVSSDPAPMFVRDRGVQVPITIHGTYEGKHGLLWRDVSKHVNEGPVVEFYTPTPGQIVEFDANELHCGTAHRGKAGHWRFFFRATMFPELPEYHNKIRKQVQIYCDVNEGW